MMAARSAHPKEPLGPGASFPDLLISDRMLIYGEARLRAVLQACARHYKGHRPHRPKPAATDCNELAVVRLTAPVQLRMLVGGTHQRVSPGRLNHPMKQQLRHDHGILEQDRPEVIQGIWVIPLC